MTKKISIGPGIVKHPIAGQNMQQILSHFEIVSYYLAAKANLPLKSSFCKDFFVLGLKIG